MKNGGFSCEGDRVVASLKELAHNYQLTAASISGIGGIYDVTVAFYNLNEKRYIEQNFPYSMNYCIALGMWQWKMESILSSQVWIADVNYQIYGGYFMEVNVSIVGEFEMDPIDGTLAK